MNEQQKKILAEFIADLELQNRSSKNARFSLGNYFDYLNSFSADFRRITIREAASFQEYLVTKTDEKGGIRYSRSSVCGITGLISTFYEFLKRRKIIHSNPFLEITRIKHGKTLPKNILNEEKMDKFLRHLRKFSQGKDIIARRNLYKAHVISELMYSTGARINEIESLKPSDIDFIKGLARIKDTKSGKYRDVILNEYASKVLTIYISMREYVLFGKNNADMTLLFGAKYNLQTQLNALLNAESKKLGLGKFTSHHFRHALGYHLLRNGCDIRYIQEILGHRALNTTQVYTRVDKEDLKNIIDAFHPRRLKLPVVLNIENEHEELRILRPAI